MTDLRDELAREGLEARIVAERVRTLRWMRDLLTARRESPVAHSMPFYTTAELIQKLDEEIRNAT